MQQALQNLFEFLGRHTRASSFYIRSWNVEISHSSNFSCSVLSITGDTAKYLDFIYFCRRSTLYPHVTIPSFCHQWPTGLVLTKMEYWQIENVTKSFQKVLPYTIASLSSAPMKHSRSPCPVTKDNVWVFLM